VTAALAEPGRRERRKAQTRRALLDAARRLFVKSGYDATRPQDIAREADLASGTFYVHFEDKRDVFLAFTEEAAHELMECVRERVENAVGFEARLLGSLEAIVSYSEQHPGVLAVAFADAAVVAAGVPDGSSLRDRLGQSLANGLREGMRKGELRSDYDPDVIGHAIVGLMLGGLRPGAQSRAEKSEQLASLVRFCARALVTPARAARKESR
jgi:AcrR family transcriptional regulator